MSNLAHHDELTRKHDQPVNVTVPSGDTLKPMLLDLMTKFDKLRRGKPEDRLKGADTAITEFLEAALDAVGQR
jgi:hypothetical protein